MPNGLLIRESMMMSKDNEKNVTVAFKVTGRRVCCAHVIVQAPTRSKRRLALYHPLPLVVNDDR